MLRYQSKWMLLLAGLWPLAGCDAPRMDSTAPMPTDRKFNSSGPDRVRYDLPKKLGIVRNDRLQEASGLARSWTHPDCFWAMNDNTGGPRLFLIDRDGELAAAYKVDTAQQNDWEGLASFTRGGKNYLLIADTGDNDQNRDDCRLYLLEEPAVISKKKGSGALDVATTISFRYSDGPHNCESVAVDPIAGKIYLVTKERKKSCRVFELPLPELVPRSDNATPPADSVQRPWIARPIATLSIPTAVAMDISPDGRRAIVLSDEAHAYEFERGEKQSWAEAFAVPPRAIEMPKRKQGESICYGPDGKSLYLHSEGQNQPLWEVPAK